MSKNKSPGMREKIKRVFYNDEFYHNIALRLKITRFLLWQLHIFIVFCFTLFNKLYPKKREIKILDREMIHKLLQTPLKYSLADVMHKLEEGFYYRNVEPGSPSLEIGSCNFFTSICFFYDKQMDIASDIKLRITPVNLIPALRIFKNFARFDAHRIPFKDASIRDIVMVHIVDHIQDLDMLLGEISRTLKKGGDFYFSGYSVYWNKLLKSKSDNKIPAFNSYHYNLFDENGWDDILGKYGMHLKDHGYFLTGKMAWFYRFTRFLYHARRGGLSIIKAMPVQDRRYEEMLLNLFIPMCERDLQRCKERNNGIHIWLHARKWL